MTTCTNKKFILIQILFYNSTVSCKAERSQNGHQQHNSRYPNTAYQYRLKKKSFSMQNTF